MIRELTGEELENAMEKGDFDPLPGTGAIIFTQSWCPQWKAMRNYLEEAAGTGRSILYTEYDRLGCFERFMRFKEETWNNREIPYVRYYKNGVFSGDSNYVPLEGFLYRLD